jgi:hypothetical protein
MAASSTPADPASKTQRFWGDYTDLYTTLLPEQVRILEGAIHLRRLRRFEGAHAIFEQCLPAAHTLPILAIERASLYQSQGLDILGSALLRKTLAWRGIRIAKIVGNEPELLGILRVKLEVRAYGKLGEAIKHCRKLKMRLKDKPLNSYTDIEVCQYYLFGCGNSPLLMIH